ncbi:MAG TPA: aminotransferase class V-fold PLP-dependent enzyme [Candidatus Dormibacteraeota bacterium]|nr:aminotransferase class V-fold PLP-dependent enzyme [Candidatus Dormibacteraeota bacterium]
MIDTEFDITAVRAQYPILEELAYFNTGTYGLMASGVLERHLEQLAAFEQRGLRMGQRLREQIEVARERLAARIGAEPGELALTGNATDGVAFTSMGIDLQPGDEVIISNSEHPAMNYPWHYVGYRYDVAVRHFEASGDPERVLASVRSLITRRTRLIGTSHITSGQGIRLPVKEICAMAHASGALALVDGAQSFGVTPIDVGEIGCDLFTSNGHKWLGGPKGTGYLWARGDLMRTLMPSYVGAGALEHDGEDGVRLWPDGRRYEFGTRGFAVTAGLVFALDWMDELGWDRVSARIEALTSRLKRQLDGAPGVRLITPVEWELSGGLVTIEVTGKDETVLQAQLEADGLYPRTVGKGSGRIRVSCALFNSEDEVDRLARHFLDFAAGEDGVGECGPAAG